MEGKTTLIYVFPLVRFYLFYYDFGPVSYFNQRRLKTTVQYLNADKIPFMDKFLNYNKRVNLW